MYSSHNTHRKNQLNTWKKASEFNLNPNRWGAYYAKLLEHHFRFLVPPGLRVLELGCGHGDLLASVNPSHGTGVDFSEAMLEHARLKHPDLSFILADSHDVEFNTTFDIIILSDLVNTLWDVQEVFERIYRFCHPGTRIILNFPNNLWRLPMSVARIFGLTAGYNEQNWFAPTDIYNLLELSGFDIVNHAPRILLPVRVPVLSSLLNRFIAGVAPFNWFALTTCVVARKVPLTHPVDSNNRQSSSVSIIIPARNEAGNISTILERIPEMGRSTELIFVEGHSNDNTYETIENEICRFPDKNCLLFRQNGYGKGDAVRLGFQKANGDIVMILDADLTVPPEDLPRFYNALVSRRGEFINGVRLVYPVENKAIRFLNMVGNKFFSLAFSWLLGQPVKDTLCGTKALWKHDYDSIASNRSYFGNFDPFGDFDLLFGAAKLNLKIVDLPIRYRQRTYGKTNIHRWRHGWILLKMVVFAALRIKFI